MRTSTNGQLIGERIVVRSAVVFRVSYMRETHWIVQHKVYFEDIVYVVLQYETSCILTIVLF